MEHIDRIAELSNKYTADNRNEIKQLLASMPVMPDKKTIVFATPSETGTSYFRIFEVALSMIRNLADSWNIVYVEQITPIHFNIADMLVLHRCDATHSKLIKVRKAYPKNLKTPCIIHDVDDNEFNLNKSHSMKMFWETAKKDKHSIYALRHSDYITTTGKYIHDVFKELNHNVEIFPNMFNWRLPQWNMFDKQREYTKRYADKIVIGYAGLTSHTGDIKKLSRIWKVIHDRHPETHFIISGMATAVNMFDIQKTVKGDVKIEQKAVDSNSYRDSIASNFKDFDPDRIELQDSKPLEAYAEFYTQYDINCIYVEHNTFNKCKSDIKLIEGLHYGSVPICSDFGPYKQFFDNNPSMRKFACTTERIEEWTDKLTMAIEICKSKPKSERVNSEKIRLVDEINYDKIDNDYDIDLHIGDRDVFYNKLANEHGDKEVSRVSKFFEKEIDQE